MVICVFGLLISLIFIIFLLSSSFYLDCSSSPAHSCTTVTQINLQVQGLHLQSRYSVFHLNLHFVTLQLQASAYVIEHCIEKRQVLGGFPKYKSEKCGKHTVPPCGKTYRWQHHAEGTVRKVWQDLEIDVCWWSSSDLTEVELFCSEQQANRSV